MKPQLHVLGIEQSPLVVVDEFTGRVDEIVGLAEALAPYPELGKNYYPGLRRIINPADGSANAYVEQLCEAAAPFLGGAFGVEAFTLLEASFSLVTKLPSQLSSAQRAPHFDSPNPKYFALLHYLRVPKSSGTAFYRQRSTGIERVSEENIDQFINTAKREAALLPPDSGYIGGSDAFFEQIGAIDAVSDRLLIYQGCLLHSGIIPDSMSFSEDPREGRLTANLFVLGS